MLPHSPASSVQLGAAAGAITGLDFAGNVDYPATTPNTPVLAWNSTIVGSTAPPAIYPMTYLWRSYPRANSNFSRSFWSYLFYVRYETTWTQGENPPHSYYGFHPWPDYDDGDEHKWEISAHGFDTVLTIDARPGVPVDYGRWHQHAATVEVVGGDEIYTFYFDWPDTTANVIRLQRAQALPMVSDPSIIIGDAPWNRGFEAPNAILRGFQFYDSVLSEAQIAAEIATPGSIVTPWYLNLNPTPSDVTDKSGNGHHPLWIDANRPALWTGP